MANTRTCPRKCQVFGQLEYLSSLLVKLIVRFLFIKSFKAEKYILHWLDAASMFPNVQSKATNNTCACRHVPVLETKTFVSIRILQCKCTRKIVILMRYLLCFQTDRFGSFRTLDWLRVTHLQSGFLLAFGR